MSELEELQAENKLLKEQLKHDRRLLSEGLHHYYDSLKEGGALAGALRDAGPGLSLIESKKVYGLALALKELSDQVDESVECTESEWPEMDAAREQASNALEVFAS